MLMKQLRKIIESIKETQSFQQAFTHTSYLNENNSEPLVSYETLEFLGDSILNFYVSLFIYRSFPEYSEGKMSKLKQLMIQESTLAQLSKEIGLNRIDEKGKLEYLKLGEGEIKNQGANKSSILADIFESFVAVLYLEKGGKAVWKFLRLTLFPWSKGKENMTWDYKSQLQEYCQAHKIKLSYQAKLEKRSKQQQLFIVEAILEDQPWKEGDQVKKKKIIFQETGMGKSKKEAEQEAAAKVLAKIVPEQKK